MPTEGLSINKPLIVPKNISLFEKRKKNLFSRKMIWAL